MTASAAPNPLAAFLARDTNPAADHSAVDRILEAVRAHLGMEIAFAARYLSDGGRFSGRQFTHLSSDLPLPAGPGDIEPVEDGYCWHILEGRLPELIQNAQDLPFAHGIGITQALPVGCHISVPLRLSDGSVYGSFCCLSRTADYSLTDRDLATVRAFADLAAGQIESELETRKATAETVQRIEDAIRHGQPGMVFQPIHRLADGKPIGVEALARFADADIRPPSVWFGEAAEVGLDEALELAAISCAVAAMPHIPAPCYVAVNVSPKVAMSGGLRDIVARAPSDRLVIEITEHAAVADYVALKRALAPLRDRARIAVDDVGAGYSGLRHILDLAPDILKLDMSLTRDVDRDPARRALIGAMVDFALSLGSAIVAEGVEHPEEAQVLRELGVECAQGWLYSRALPPVAVQHYLLGASGLASSAPVARSPKRRVA